MSTFARLVAARAAAVLAIASALAIVWIGWWALVLVAAFLVIGFALAPPASAHPHRTRGRALLAAIERRVIRHPWRARRP